MNLKVERISYTDYKVIGDAEGKNIDSKVTYYNHYSNNNRVRGKGSRNFKTEILESVSNFIQSEIKAETEAYEQEQEELKKHFQNSPEYENINLLSLYDATTMNKEYDSHHYRKTNRLLTGIEIKEDFNNVIEIKKHKIENTNIYNIGREYSRRAAIDSRFVVIGLAKHTYITGLTLKELLYNGYKTYENLHHVKGTELEVVVDRMFPELERAVNNEFKEPEPRFTHDGKPIRRAWFSSKAFSFTAIKNKELATYDSYAIIKKVELNKNEFDLFKQSLDLSILKTEFKGGTESTFTDLSNTDYFKNTEEEQQRFNREAYRLALQVTCPDYNHSVLVDPQGYDYARYAALISE